MYITNDFLEFEISAKYLLFLSTFVSFLADLTNWVDIGNRKYPKMH